VEQVSRDGWSGRSNNLNNNALLGEKKQAFLSSPLMARCNVGKPSRAAKGPGPDTPLTKGERGRFVKCVFFLESDSSKKGIMC